MGYNDNVPELVLLAVESPYHCNYLLKLWKVWWKYIPSSIWSTASYWDMQATASCCVLLCAHTQQQMQGASGLSIAMKCVT